MTHPHVLHATAALWSLRRAAEVYLPAMVEASAGGSSSSTQGTSRPRPRAALRQLDDLLRIERHERIVADRAGIHQVGATSAPVPPHLVDAQQLAAQALVDAHWLAASALAGCPLLAWDNAWYALGDHDRVRRGWLTMAVPHVLPATAAAIADLLDATDRRVRAAIRVDPDEIPMPGGPPCPACGLRRLRLATAAPHSVAWTVTCRPQCTCRGPGEPSAGDGCVCGMPTRVNGVRHIWDGGSQVAASALEAMRGSAA